MSLHIYQGGSTLNNIEKRMLERLITTLRERFEVSEQFCFLFIGYQCVDRQIDATIIKHDAIINIELKDIIAEKAVVEPQGNLKLSPKRYIRSLGNPVEQVRQQNYAVKNLIYDNQEFLFGGKALGSPNDLDVLGCIVLNSVQYIDTDKLGKQRAFLKVIDLSRIASIIKEYKGRDFLGKQSSLQLDNRFALRLVEILRLNKINNLEYNDSPEFGSELRSYLESIGFNLHKYVHRQDIENKLLTIENVIVVGSPGAGKSTMMKMLVYNHAKEELRKATLGKTPCLLNLIDTDYIIGIISGEVGIDEENVKELLGAGAFWVVFDGIDEMTDFKVNLPRLTDFINRFPLNLYTITVRRDVYNNADYREYFDKLKREKHKFNKVEIEKLGDDDISRLLQLKLGNIFNQEVESQVRSLLHTIPDITPLDTEIAVETLNDEHGGNFVYENKGRWYEEFFKRRLKRECRKTRSAGRDSFILLSNVLTKLGWDAINKGDPFFEKDLVYQIINEEMGEKASEYYDLLLRSEVLKSVNVTITRGKDIRYDEQLQFFHQTYLEFYTAKSLVGKLGDHELLGRMLSEKILQNSLVMLCGIEPDRVIIDKIIRRSSDDWNIDLACACLMNTHNCSNDIPAVIAKKVIEKSENNKDYKIYVLLEDVQKYGKAILTPELDRYLNRVTDNDIIQKIDWEAYKSIHLRAQGVSEIYKKTPRFAYKYDNIKGKYNESCARLAYSPEAQNMVGYDFYLKLIKIHSMDEIWHLALDGKYESFLRCKIFYDLRQKCWGDIKLFRKAISRLWQFSERWMDHPKDIRWEIIPFFIYYEDADDENDISLAEKEAIANDAIQIFWKETSGPVQLRIIVGSYKYPDLIRKNLYENILHNYSNEHVFILEELEPIWDEEFYGEVDWCVSTVDMNYGEIIGSYSPNDFQGEAYTTLIKCEAMNYGVYLFRENLKANDHIFRKMLERYSFSINEKLKNMAEWALEELDKSKL